MDVAFFKERFNTTESAYLLARRANSRELNSHAVQAIEEIIIERGERLPVLAVKSDAEQPPLKETKADQFWRFTAMIAASIWLIVMLKTYTTSFIHDWAEALVGSVVFSRFIYSVSSRFSLKSALSKFRKRTGAVIHMGAAVMTVALSYYVMVPKSIDEIKYSASWYMYGLIFTDAVDDFEKQLAPYNIKVRLRGCIMGGDEYNEDMKNNQRIYESASDELKSILGHPSPLGRT